MKNRIAATAAGCLIMLSAGQASAATFQGVIEYYPDGFKVTWNNVASSCGFVSLGNLVFSPVKTKIIVYGIEAPELTPATISQSFDDRVVIYSSSVKEGISHVTINGASSLTCAGDTFLLPGHGVPVSAPAPVPTLSEWAMILFGSVLAGGAALYIQRRRVVAG